MRYALISDIHANLTALQCVLSDISKLRVDKIICLGDTMGYGPQPAESLELVYQVAECHLLGNHDAAVCGKLNPIIFSPSAKKAVIKHRKMVSEKAVRWLGSMPLTLKAPSFRCVHGDFTKPGAFRYIITEEDALPSFMVTNEQLMFAGHTHLAGIYVIGASGSPHFIPPRDFTVEDDKRYIINPGTVGYPRSGKFESTYCIFDSDQRTIVFRHIPFDHVAYNNALQAAGFDEIPWIKAKTAGLSLPDVRKRLSFTKPLSDEYHLNETIIKLTTTHREQIKKYRLLIIIITLLSLMTGGILIHRVHRVKSDSSVLRIPEGKMEVINARSMPAGSENFLTRFPDEAVTGEPLTGWRYIVADRTSQKISITRSITGQALVVTHKSENQFVLESPLISLSGSGLEYIRLKGRIRKLAGFRGNVFYQLQSYLTKDDGSIERYKVDSFEVRGRSSEGADVAAISRKVLLAKKTSHIRLRVEADFTGALELRLPELAGHNPSIPSTKNSEGNIP